MYSEKAKLLPTTTATDYICLYTANAAKLRNYELTCEVIVLTTSTNHC